MERQHDVTSQRQPPGASPILDRPPVSLRDDSQELEGTRGSDERAALQEPGSKPVLGECTQGLLQLIQLKPTAATELGKITHTELSTMASPKVTLPTFEGNVRAVDFQEGGVYW